MERVTFEEVVEKYPDLSLDILEGVYYVANLFPKVTSLPNKRIAYEAQVYAKDQIKGKMNAVPAKAKSITDAVCQLVTNHESRTDAHPEGNEAFIEGEKIKGNPFPYDTLKSDHMRWRREWLAESKE